MASHATALRSPALLLPILLSLLASMAVLPPAAAATTTPARRPTRSECDAHAEDGLCDSRKYKRYMEYCERACDDYRRRRRNEALQEEMMRPQPRNPMLDVDEDEDEEDSGDSGDAAEGVSDEDGDDEDDKGEDSEDNEDEGYEDEEEEKPSLHPQFFGLSALDIDKRELYFSDFEGKITIITNVASECGYTESHYKGMVELYNTYAKTRAFNIVAFPCNQFDEQEPGTNAEIKKFAKDAGVEFIIMDKIDVNGPHTHTVYEFLKRAVGPQEIEWNFAVYYVVGPDGSIRSFSDIEPEDLEDIIEELLSRRDEL